MKLSRKFIVVHFAILFLFITTNIYARENLSLRSQRIDAVEQYITLLGNGNYQSISHLFTKNALVVSSSGKPDEPSHFYKRLFTKTITNPQATLINVFEGKLDQNMLTAYFDFSWKNIEKKQVTIKFLDLFVFEKNSAKIKLVFVFSNTFQEDIMKQLNKGKEFF